MGGGDGPESVNQALYDAVHEVSWSDDSNVYRDRFPGRRCTRRTWTMHNDVKYPVTLAGSRAQGHHRQRHPERSAPAHPSRPGSKLPRSARASYFQVEDSGNAVAVATPFDEEAVRHSRPSSKTPVSTSATRKPAKAQKAKLDANARLRKELSSEALARRRSAFNATASGKKNLLGESELVDAVTSGRVDLEEIKREDLPASMQMMAPAEAMEVITEQAQRRQALKQEIRELSESRNRFIKKKVDAAGGADDSLDEKIYRAVKDQAASVGLSYDSDNAKY